jgi:hypothetical protein
MSRRKKKQKEEEAFQMAVSPREDGWFDGQRYIPFRELPNTRLQTAKLYAQRKQLHYFNKAAYFSELVEKLENEAEKRGIELRDFNTEFHKNERHFKNQSRGKSNNQSDVQGEKPFSRNITQEEIQNAVNWKPR